MADPQLKSNIIKENPIVKHLDNVHALFTSICANRKLPHTGDALDQLCQDDLQKLMIAFLRALQNHPAADLLPAKTGQGTLRSDLLRLELRLSDHDFDLDRVKPPLKRTLANDVTDSAIWDQVYLAVAEAPRSPHKDVPPSATDWPDDLIWFPCGLGLQDLLGAGISGYAGRLDAAVKWVQPNNTQFIQRERRVYERLDEGHHGLLRYHGPVENGVILQFACNGSIRQYRAKHGNHVPLLTRLQWMQQVAETIAFLHSKDVFHGDISCNNIFLDEDLNAKVADFAGSAIDGEPGLTCYETSHSHPGTRTICAESEIFALGSTFYEIITGFTPFHELESHEIEKAFSRNQFPSIPTGACHEVIRRCWDQDYKTIDSLVTDVNAEVVKHRSEPSRLPGYVSLLPGCWVSRTMCCVSLISLAVWWRIRRV